MAINRPYTWEELGLLGESVRAPAMLARRTAELDAARDELAATRTARDQGGDRSLPALDAVCHAAVDVHRAEQALAAAERDLATVEQALATVEKWSAARELDRGELTEFEAAADLEPEP